MENWQLWVLIVALWGTLFVVLMRAKTQGKIPNRYEIRRADEPITFWFFFSFYAALFAGLSCLLAAEMYAVLGGG